jgi:general secretion pathway protein H
MRTSTTKTSKQSGFSLIELLVVVSIAGIVLSVVILGFTGADREQELKGTVERMTLRLEMARQYALQRNREWGMYVSENDYSFAELDPLSGEWIKQEYKPFIARENFDQVVLRVKTEGFDPALLGADRKTLPQIILFSSGEVTPFDLIVEPEWDTPMWIISSDGISDAMAERAG